MAVPPIWRWIHIAGWGGWLFVAGAFGLEAQTVTEIQPLSLGAIAVSKNSTKESLTIQLDGKTKRSSGIIPTVPGSVGQFALNGFPSSQSLAVSIDPVVLSLAGDGLGKTFSLGFSYFPLVTTDANGDAVLDIGATLKTSGDGTSYGNNAHFGNATISFSW